MGVALSLCVVSYFDCSGGLGTSTDSGRCLI